MKTIRSASLPYVLSVPETTSDAGWPILVFLHGYDEGPPTDVVEGMTRHGPLRPENPPVATRDFLVIAPQMPQRGDLWRKHAAALQHIVREAADRYHGDLARVHLTGFSFGGNGVFDLALEATDFWRSLWAVDPTRVPARDPGLPVILSSGEISRRRARAFIDVLKLEIEDQPVSERTYFDAGLDHVATAARAYGSEHAYTWLKQREIR